jgi:hypothetical protein
MFARCATSSFWPRPNMPAELLETLEQAIEDAKGSRLVTGAAIPSGLTSMRSRASMGLA